MNLIRHAALMLSVATPLAVGLISCDDDKNEPENPNFGPITEVMSPDNAFNVISTPTTTYTTTGTKVKVVFFEGSRTATVAITNLILDKNSAPKNYYFESLPWSYGENREREIDLNNVTDDKETMSFSDFEISSLPNMKINGTEHANLAVKFSTRNGYDYMLIPSYFTTTARTITRNNTDGSERVALTTTYSFELDPASYTCSMYVNNADFAAGMPPLGEMLFDNINVTYTYDGFQFNNPSLIPSIAGVPSPNRPVTNLSGEVEIDDDGDLQFTCMRVFSVTASLSAPYFPLKLQ